MLSYRETVYDWIKIRVGSRTSTRFWTDHWCTLGKLDDYLIPRGSNSMGIPSQATLAEINHNGEWELRPARSDRQVEVQCILSTITLTTEPDYYEWEVEGKIYKLLKEHQPTVPWYKVVWSKSGIPKHNFQAWLAVLNRMPTRDRQLSWNLNVSPTCLLCNNSPETRDHIFLACSYSEEIWIQLVNRCLTTPSSDWHQTLASICNSRGPQWKRNLINLVWQLSIYAIWTERNHRLHRNCFRSPSSIVACSDSIVRNRIQSLRDSNPAVSSTSRGGRVLFYRDQTNYTPRLQR